MMPQKDETEETPTEGEPLQEHAYHGPVKIRSCTDVVCLLLYLVFVTVWAAIAIFAFLHGDPMRVINPTDSKGLTCGIDEQVKDKPYLFFFDMMQCTNLNSHGQCSTPQVCVTECPNKDDDFSSYRIQNAKNLTDLKQSLICKYAVNVTAIKSQDTIKKLVAENSCAKSYMESVPHYGRCVPKRVFDLIATLKAAVDQVEQDNSTISMQLLKYIKKIDSFKEGGKMVVADLVASWPYILAAMVQAMLLSLLYLFLLKLLAGPLIWISAFGSIALLSFVVFGSLKKYEVAETPDELKNFSFVDIFNSQTYELLINSKPFWLGITIIAATLLLTVFVLIVFLRKRVQLATAIIGEASKAVHAAKASLIFPAFVWIFQLLAFFLFIAIAIYLYTSAIDFYKVEGLSGASCNCTSDGKEYKDGSLCSPSSFAEKCGSECNEALCELDYRGKDVKTPIYHFLNLVCFLWVVCFTNAFEQMVLSGAFASWYCTLNKKFVPFFVVTKAATRTLRYHMGTIAFGSLILAACKTIRITIHTSQVLLEKYKKHRVVQIIFTCCQCFFYCVEKVLKFISSNAYVMCAIHGKNFCTSARTAFSLLVNNMVRAIVLDRMTDFVLMLGKLLIISILCFSWYMFFDEEMDIWITKAPKLNFTFIPSAIIAIATYFITTQFLYVYSVAVKTIFICFLEDCNVNDGTSEKPYCMSTSLLKVLGARNVKVHEE